MVSPESPVVPRRLPILDTAVAVAAGIALGAAGFAAGIVGGFAGGWLAWLGAVSTPYMVLAFGGALSYLALMFAGCRLGAAGLGRKAGGVLPAAGWITAVLLVSAYTPGGGMVVSDSPVNYLLVYGGMLVVAAAALTAPERLPRPEREKFLAQQHQQQGVAAGGAEDLHRPVK